MSFFIIQMYVLYFKLFADLAKVFFLLSGDGNQGNWGLECFVVFYLSILIFKLSFLVFKKKLYVFFSLFPELIEQQILEK